MSKLRRLLVPLTAAWLSLHVVVTGTTIAVLAAGGATSDVVCTCEHGGDHDSCPMHGTRKDSTRCRLQGTQDDLGSALMSVLGPLVLPATSNVAAVDAPSPGPIGYASPSPSGWFVPPEPPPPRS